MNVSQRPGSVGRGGDRTLLRPGARKEMGLSSRIRYDSSKPPAAKPGEWDVTLGEEQARCVPDEQTPAEAVVAVAVAAGDEPEMP